MKTFKFLVLGILVLAIEANNGAAKKPKAVFMPFIFGSHMTEHITVGKALQRKGFEVHLIINSLMPVDRAKKSGLKVYVIEVDIVMPPAGTSLSFFRQPGSWDSWAKVLNTVCRAALWDDDKLINYFKQEQFDISINDAMLFCLYTIPHELKIPYVSLTTPLFHNVLNISPYDINACTLELDRSFIGRLKHIYAVYTDFVIPATCIFKNDSFVNMTSHTPYNSLLDLSRNSMLFLVNQHPLLECSTPTLPYIKHVGGLDTKKPKPLEGEFAKFADSAKEGLVIISFGSLLQYLDEPSVEKFMNVFERLPYKFIWRLVFPTPELKKKTKVPNNVMLTKWMPQNDLLGHKNAVLFVTHGGNNGAHEGLANGVPMLNVPIFGDQPYNAIRNQVKKYGDMLNIFDFTEKDLESKINEIITNPIYRKTIQNAAKKFNANPIHPSDKAADYIEYAMKYGTEELVPIHNEIPLYQKLLWDILIVALAVIFGTIFVVVKVLKKLCSKDKSGKRQKKD